MNYLLNLLFFFLLSCNSQSVNDQSDSIDFEEVNHFAYSVISGESSILDSQEKIEAVYKIVRSNIQGNRYPPIPVINSEETYVVFKPVLKNSNDIKIKKIYLQNKNLYIVLDEFDNPQKNSTSRVNPSVLVKLLEKVNAKKIVIQYEKRSK